MGENLKEKEIGKRISRRKDGLYCARYANKRGKRQKRRSTGWLRTYQDNWNDWADRGAIDWEKRALMSNRPWSAGMTAAAGGSEYVRFFRIVGLRWRREEFDVLSQPWEAYEPANRA